MVVLLFLRPAALGLSTLRIASFRIVIPLPPLCLFNILESGGGSFASTSAILTRPLEASTAVRTSTGRQRIGRDARVLTARLHWNRSVVLVRFCSLQDVVEEVPLCEIIVACGNTITAVDQ